MHDSADGCVLKTNRTMWIHCILHPENIKQKHFRGEIVIPKPPSNLIMQGERYCVVFLLFPIRSNALCEICDNRIVSERFDLAQTTDRIVVYDEFARVRSTTPGLVVVVCGFVLANSTVISALVAAAEPERCEPRTGPNNGHALFMASKNRRTSAVEVYQCDVRYTLTGRAKHTCAGGRWTGDVPSCTRIDGGAGEKVYGAKNNAFPVPRVLPRFLFYNFFFFYKRLWEA